MRLDCTEVARNAVMGGLAAALFICSTGCGGGEGSPAPIGQTTNPLTGGHTDGTTTASGTGTSNGTADSSTTDGVTNCNELLCVGHGACVIDEQTGATACVCDEGYVLEDGGCVVDETCVQVRFLEDHCRQLVNLAPAVSLYFALDFCSGTAVSPQKRNELGIEFHVLENGVDLSDNVESYATVILKPVESYVTLVLDVSDSITGSQDLPALIDQLQLLLTQLVPEDGGPEVYVSVYVFGRDVAEYVPFTREFSVVDAALQAIADDPSPVVFLAGNGNGTDLYDAVELGIHRTQRIRDLREMVTDGGVLSAGTVVVVTDGKDTSNGTLDTALVEQTTNNVISIGISGEIDDEDLQRIGRDGSFLAPTVAEWPAAFAEIADRVDAYPGRSYLLAYCSSATEGEPEVEVIAKGPGIATKQSAVCKFNADRFGTDASLICDALLFATECSTATCSGLTACGACADDECCVKGMCVSPLTALDCAGQDDLCAAADQICGANGQCTDWTPIGGMTCGEGCEPGVGFCNADNEPDSCVPTRQLGAQCDGPHECGELNCTRVNEDNALEHPVCRPRAQLYDFCGTDEAVCEAGGYCESTCKPRKVGYESCSGSDACRSGVCVSVPDAGNLCDGSQACFWSWDEKVPS